LNLDLKYIPIMKTLLSRFLNRGFILATIFFIFVFSCFYFKAPGYNPFSAGYILFYSFFLILSFVHSTKKVERIFFLLALFFVLSFGIITDNTQRYFSVIILHLLPICIYLFFKVYCSKQFLVSFFYLLYYFALINIVVILLPKLGIKINIGNQTPHGRSMGLFPNPNMLGVYLSFVFFFWILLKRVVFSFNSILFVFNFLLFGSALWFSQSRRSMFVFVLYIFYVLIKQQKFQKLYLSATIVIFTIGLSYFNLFEIAYDFINSLINLQVSDLSLSTRLLRSSQALDYVLSDPSYFLFGTWGEFGEIGSFFTNNDVFTALDVYPVLLISDVGFFGLLFMIWIYYNCSKTNFTDDEFLNTHNKAFLSSIVLTSLFGNTIVTFPIFLIIPLYMAYIKRTPCL